MDLQLNSPLFTFGLDFIAYLNLILCQHCPNLINYFCHVISKRSLWLHGENVRSIFNTVKIMPPGRQKYTRKMRVFFVLNCLLGRSKMTNLVIEVVSFFSFYYDRGRIRIEFSQLVEDYFRVVSIRRVSYHSTLTNKRLNR